MVNRKTYNLELGDVELTWTEHRPKNSDGTQIDRPKNAMVFLPGHDQVAGSGAQKELSQEFGDKQVTYTITAEFEPKNSSGDKAKDIRVLYQEALAIAMFIREKGLEEVTLSGISEGGNRSIDLAKILQSNPEIKIRGLVLLDAVGLYEQKFEERAKDVAVEKRNFALKHPIVSYRMLRSLTASRLRKE